MPIHQTNNYWILETDHTAYTLALSAEGTLLHHYWSTRLPYVEDYQFPAITNPGQPFSNLNQLRREEYPGYGGIKYTDPCLKTTFADGVRDVVLCFDSADVQESQLNVILRDAHYPLQLMLHYRAHERYDLIERWVSIRNMGNEPIQIDRIYSAQWHLPQRRDYRLTHLTGRWADEWHLRREPLVHGLKVLESRRLTTSHQHNPYFAIDEGNATEEHGNVWFGALAWSGNWKITGEVSDFGTTHLNIGLNDFDFNWTLHPSETFTTPSSYAGYTPNGFGEASRRMHDFIRDTLLPHKHTPHKVLYNSWEATFFNVDEQSQTELAKIAAEIGVELFVMDDGWFHNRNSDNAGLGDWWPDTKKFPNGLQPLIKNVNDLGMDFGLWIEPEMVNPDSDLYRTHPEWAIHFPTRSRSESRNQLILNLARQDVQDYIIAQIDKLLTENNIAFIKWDMNRNVSEPGSPDALFDGRELWVRYVQGVYRVWGTLRERHPNVIWQSCSGGGGRADLGILRLADQIWISDNTEATTRLAIQEGFSYLFPANTMEAWVTDWSKPYVPLEFRFHVAMCGSLGIGSHLLHWTTEQRAEAARLVALYKEIRPIVQFGDMYRLRSPQQHRYSAVQYMSKDRQQGVLFIFRTHDADMVDTPSLTLCGLDPDTRYSIEGFEGVRSGLAWMQTDIAIPPGNFQSRVCRISAM